MSFGGFLSGSQKRRLRSLGVHPGGAGSCQRMACRSDPPCEPGQLRVFDPRRPRSDVCLGEQRGREDAPGPWGLLLPSPLLLLLPMQPVASTCSEEVLSHPLAVGGVLKACIASLGTFSLHLLQPVLLLLMQLAASTCSEGALSRPLAVGDVLTACLLSLGTVSSDPFAYPRLPLRRF